MSFGTLLEKQNIYREVERDLPERAQSSSLISRNISVAGRRTSVRLEPEMWDALRDIVAREGCSLNGLCTQIERRKRVNSSLTAAIRVFIMLYYRAAATDEGHTQAGHGALRRFVPRVASN